MRSVFQAPPQASDRFVSFVFFSVFFSPINIFASTRFYILRFHFSDRLLPVCWQDLWQTPLSSPGSRIFFIFLPITIQFFIDMTASVICLVSILVFCYVSLSNRTSDACHVFLFVLPLLILLCEVFFHCFPTLFNNNDFSIFYRWCRN